MVLISQLRALLSFWWGGAEVPGVPGQEHDTSMSWCRCQTEHLLLLRCTERWQSLSQLSFRKTMKVLDCKSSNSYIWIKSSKKPTLNSSSAQTFPVWWLWCFLANPQAHSVVRCLQPESLEAVFQSLSPSTLCPQRRRYFITSGIFLTNLKKAYLIFFLTMACLLSMFILP